MAIFLAIDAGGTKTEFLLGDGACQLGRARARSIKRIRVSEAEAIQHLDDGLLQLTIASGVTLDQISCTCVGTAGETVPLVVQWLRKSLSERVAGELVIVGDVEIALDSAFGDDPGVLILAGTGSNVAGRGKNGEIVRAGGWGPALGDEGSGYRIGHRALQATVRAIDTGRSTELFHAVLNEWKLDSIHDLVEFANSRPFPDFSSLAQVVAQAAGNGDSLAMEILEAEGLALAEVALIVLRKLQAEPEQAQWLPRCAVAGSILEKVLPVRRALQSALNRALGNVEISSAPRKWSCAKTVYVSPTL